MHNTVGVEGIRVLNARILLPSLAPTQINQMATEQSDIGVASQANDHNASQDSNIDAGSSQTGERPCSTTSETPQVAKRLKSVSDDFKPRTCRESIKEYARHIGGTLLQARNSEGEERRQIEEV
jgi:hypothetical protein